MPFHHNHVSTASSISFLDINRLEVSFYLPINCHQKSFVIVKGFSSLNKKLRDFIDKMSSFFLVHYTTVNVIPDGANGMQRSGQLANRSNIKRRRTTENRDTCRRIAECKCSC
ncbi:hypothetical protein TNCV_3729911 [Trichonephila clavipes]|nr:hypothetical protein TNCV_3729911 [Trichonephila clavipes]